MLDVAAGIAYFADYDFTFTPPLYSLRRQATDADAAMLLPRLYSRA